MSATFTANTFTVTPTAGANGTISPNMPQQVTLGQNAVFTVTPNPGYSASVGGTCGGSLVGTTFTTAAIASACTVAASFTQNVTLVSVNSRKVHGAAGTYNLPVDRSALINGAVTVEPRVIGAGHSIVFQFSAPVTILGTASATGAIIANATAGAAADEVIVTLTNVADAQRVTVSLTGVNATTNASVSLGFLVGDVNNTGSVIASDASAVKARAGQTTNAGNFVYDLNATGVIGASDIAAAKKRIGKALP